MNNINLLGRLTACPIPRGSDERLAAAFSLAVKRPYKDKNGNFGVDFIDVVAFGKLGELCLHYLGKGRLVCVSGRLEINKYTGSDGVTRQRCCVIADSVDFCDSPSAVAPAAPAAPAAAAAPAAPFEDEYPVELFGSFSPAG